VPQLLVNFFFHNEQIVIDVCDKQIAGVLQLRWNITGFLSQNGCRLVRFPQAQVTLDVQAGLDRDGSVDGTAEQFDAHAGRDAGVVALNGDFGIIGFDELLGQTLGERVLHTLLQ